MMVFSLLKCLWTHCRRHFKPFSGQKCTKLQDFVYTISKFSEGGATPSPAVLGPQFPLGLPIFPLLLFHKTTTTKFHHCWQYQKCICFKCTFEKQPNNLQQSIARSQTAGLVIHAFLNWRHCQARDISVPLTKIYCTYHVTDSARTAAPGMLVRPPGTVFRTLSAIRNPPKLLLRCLLKTFLIARY